jgi:drug/metabolite transporter (DMT)-like permease
MTPTPSLKTPSILPRGNLRAIAWMLLSTLMLISMQASARHVSGSLHPFEVVFFTNLFGIFVVLPSFVRHGLEPLRTSRFRLHALRAGLQLSGMLMFFTGLTLTPLAVATSLYFTAPIFASILASFIFRESIGVKRWAAILFGFAGTMVVLRPGLEEIGIGAPLIVVASMLWAGALLTIKATSRTDSSITITSYVVLLITPLSLVPALFFWQWPTWDQLSWLLLIGLLQNGGQMILAQALREGDTVVIMPFDFVRLIWATAIAWVAFSEIPDLFTWIGGIMIFASVVYIADRERRKSGKP